jgi:hypothetical protein
MENTTNTRNNNILLLPNEERRREDDSHLEKDLLLIAKWAKEVLFRSCKFIYRRGGGKGTAGSMDESTDESRTYKLFERDCVPTLRGGPLTAVSTTTTEQKRYYISNLWRLAQASHTISKALSVRRTCVYTVMQNRFNGKNWSTRWSDDAFRLSSPHLLVLSS